MKKLWDHTDEILLNLVKLLGLALWGSNVYELATLNGSFHIFIKSIIGALIGLIIVFFTGYLPYEVKRKGD